MNVFSLQELQLNGNSLFHFRQLCDCFVSCSKENRRVLFASFCSIIFLKNFIKEYYSVQNERKPVVFLQKANPSPPRCDKYSREFLSAFV